MDGNILSGGVDILYTAKKNLLELSSYKDKNDVLVTEEAKLEKSIQTKEKAISDEIVNTTKKRKDEIEDTYDKQIDKTRARIKKIRSKKERSKNAKKSERIESDTAELREEHKQLNQECKTIYNQNHLPAFSRTRLFFALFMPKGLGDIAIIVSTLVLILLIIPCAIYFLLLPVEKIIYLVLIYIITVILFGGIYMRIENSIKDKYREVLNKIRLIRNSMVQNKKIRKKIIYNIRKDRDESLYGLEKFNQELQDLDNEINAITEQKTNALSVFDNTTKSVIGDEIKARNQEELSNLKQEYDSIYAEIKTTADMIKNLSLEIASTYEAYLGKEFMSVEKIDQLTNLMTTNNLTTISEAIALYKQSSN